MLANLVHLKSKYDLKVSNIAHVGAHQGQEVNIYLNIFPIQIYIYLNHKKIYLKI